MKIISTSDAMAKRTARRRMAMTLVEIMISMAIFGLVMIALLYANMFGMLQDQLVNSKLGSSDQSRRAFDKFTGDIRSAKIWMIGNGSDTGFTPIKNGDTQLGNAIQISSTTDTNSYTRYYFDTNNAQLCRKLSGASGHTLVARYLTNNMYFQAEDYLGNVKTDLSYKYVIHVVMEFCQYQYPLTKVGPGYYYDFYKMEFKITPHCPDGA
jgi:type II secretory pathway pseudopilin PulG